MEEFFTHKCVSAAAAPSADVSQWAVDGRCENVLVQEMQAAHGASRAILARVLDMLLSSNKTSTVVLLTLEWPGLSASGRRDDGKAKKLKHVDLSDDTDLFCGPMLTACSEKSNPVHDQLLQKIYDHVVQLDDTHANRSTRSVVVVLDSINALVQQCKLGPVLQLFRKLRALTFVGSVVARVNGSCVPQATRQALVAQCTTLLHVETTTSLSMYPMLSKERRREIPRGVDGFVLFLRLKKNGRSNETVEYFRFSGPGVVFVDQANAVAASDTSLGDSSLPADSSTSSLPVPQADVSFNIGTTIDERQAKSQVVLPFMQSQQRSTTEPPSHQQQPLFFIDEDDPEWDDDDLDDDLDI